MDFELAEELTRAWVHGGNRFIEAREVVVAEGQTGLVAGGDQEQGALLVEVFDRLIVNLSADSKDVEPDTRGFVLAVRLMEEGKMWLTGQKKGVGEEAELSREIKKREGPDACFLVVQSSFQIRLAQDVDGTQQRTNLGEGGVRPLFGVGDIVSIDVGSAARQRTVRGDIRVWDEVGTREALDQQVEGLGSVDINGLMEGPRLCGLDEASDIACAMIAL